MSDLRGDAVTAKQLEIHKSVDAPKIGRLTHPQLLQLASTRLQKPFLPTFSTVMDLTARNPYDKILGSMDIFQPGRWDTASNLIFMGAIVQGKLAGEWTGSAAYAHFTPITSGQHLIAVHFTGFQTTMRLHGPWGTATATTSTVHDAGAVIVFAQAAAGTSIYFTIDCIVPGNLPGIGYLQAVEAFN